MPKNKRRRPNSSPQDPLPPDETPASEVLTVAWAVAVTMVITCNLVAAAAHLYFRYNPQSRNAAMLGSLMLLAGAMIGAGALVVTPIIYRVRRNPPPIGFVVFAVCAAVAPILAVLTRVLQ